MQNLLVELAEMSRQITAQIDTRAAKLEALIHEADARIAELKTAGISSGGSSFQTIQPASYPASTSHSASGAIEQPGSHHSDVYALADQGRDAYEIAAQLGRPRGEVELILALRSK